MFIHAGHGTAGQGRSDFVWGEPVNKDEARLIVRAYNPTCHRSRDWGYQNPYIQKAFAILLREIHKREPKGTQFILLGEKGSGTILGSIAQYMYPQHFLFVPLHHSENYEAVAGYPRESVILVDDYINEGSTLISSHQKVPFGRMVTIGAGPNSLKAAESRCNLHVLSDMDWLEGKNILNLSVQIA